MGRSVDGRDASTDYAWATEQPEHTAFVSSFELDRFEVTVGRFRRFVEQYTGAPAVGAGQHPQIPGSGWKSSWDAALPPTRQALETLLNCPNAEASGGYSPTYTSEPGDNENSPITCVDWFTAFAFCIWDGGRLPTETEWEYAAAGGEENRLFPWAESSVDSTRAAYHCLAYGDGDCSMDDLLDVDALPAGRGRWGHAHMAGNVWEWTLDWQSWYDLEALEQQGCKDKDCANLIQGPTGRRIIRGGGFLQVSGFARSAHRDGPDPSDHFWDRGVRCARDSK